MKWSLLELIVDSLLETPSGILFKMEGGWLEETETYFVSIIVLHISGAP